MAGELALVALDGSSVAEQVLPWAKAFARDASMKLLLVEIVPEQGASPEHAQAERAAVQHYLDGAADDLRAAGIELTHRAEFGSRNVAESLIAQAAESNAALIMMATHGRSGVKRMVLGSVATEVIEKATSNVLVIKATAEGEKILERRVRRVLLTVDGSPRAEAALPVAAQYARAFGATLEIVQVAPLAAMLFAGSPEVYVPEGLDQRIEQSAVDYLGEVRKKVPAGITVEANVMRGDAAGCILDLATTGGADLIVMTTHGRGGLARWTLGSVADRVVRAGSAPVLLVATKAQ